MQSASPLPSPYVVPAHSPLPSRKVIRAWLAPLCRRSTPLALALLALDVALWAATLAAVVWFEAWWMKLVAGLALGVVIARLFIIGHDACHQSYTDHRRLNRWLGRLAFLPSLTPYSLWEVGHNVVHHGFTNLKGRDFVWQPLTPAEYAALSPARRWLERVYRSGWAPGLYYLVEIWWLRMFFPSRRQLPAQRGIFLADSTLAAAAGVAWVGGLVLAAQATGQSAWALVGWGFVLPFAVWNALIGFVVYVHHTHVEVDWHADKAAWAASDPFISTTVHLRFPLGLGGLLHHIMEHTAHHLDMGIPLYRLRRAQALLERALPGRIVVQRFSWRWYAQTARRCKLYDLAGRCWTDFRGRPTTAPAAT
jgi:acyl-lipid omega-6 desaturase (Delta-12 desaturase)